MKILNARQREFFSVLLTDPSLTRLQALFRELSAQQRWDLLAFLSAPASSAPVAIGALGSIAPESISSGGNSHETDQARNRTTETSCGSPPQDGKSTVTAQGESPPSAGVVFTVTPEVIDGRQE